MKSFIELENEILEFKHLYDEKNSEWISNINYDVGFELISSSDKILNMFVGHEETCITVVNSGNQIQYYSINHKTKRVNTYF